jgi:hypothetical protein
MKIHGLTRKKQQTDNITTMSVIIILSILILTSTYLFSLIMHTPPSQKALAQQLIDNKTGMIMDPESGMMMTNNSKNGKLMMMDPKSNMMMMMDNTTGMMMVMDPDSGKVMIKDRRCGMVSISVIDILKVFTPC